MSENVPTIIDKSKPLNALNLSFGEIEKFSAIVAKTQLVPKAFQERPYDCFVAIQFGQEIGLAPMQAFQSIFVVNGRPSLLAEAALALAYAGDVIESYTDSWDDKTQTATVTIKRKGQPNTITRTFSMEDARIAGLATKENYLKYKQDMCFARALSRVLKKLVPDKLRGLSIYEDIIDLPTTEYTDVTPTSGAPDKSLMEPREKPVEKNPPPVEETPAAPETPESTPEGFISAAQRRMIFGAIREKKIPEDAFKSWAMHEFDIRTRNHIPSDGVPKVLNWIANWKPK